MAVTLRTERPQEAEEIAQLIERAFRSAPHTNHQEQNIVAALRRDGALTLSLVAEQDGALCGYAAMRLCRLLQSAMARKAGMVSALWRLPLRGKIGALAQG